MLSNILKEIGRAFRDSSGTAKAERERHTDLRHAFQTGSAKQRRDLLESLRQRLQCDPTDLEGKILFGDWCLQLHQHGDAESAYREALKAQPMNARAQEGLGLALLYLGRAEESYLHFETACKVNPSNSDAWTHWGLVELELCNLGEAAAKFQRAIERHPGNPHAWHNLGLVAFRQGRSQQSVEHLERCLQLKPDHGLAYSNLALAALRCEDLDKALYAAEKAIELKRDTARVWTVHGDVAVASGDYETASNSFSRAAALAAETAAPWIGMGRLHMSTGRLEEADEAFVRAITLEPHQAEARAARGQLQLLRGNWPLGWDLYEARRSTASTPVRAMTCPEWQGEDPAGRRILVHTEQGLGDIILFSSCVRDLVDRGARCVVEAPPRLYALFRRSFPEVDVVNHDPIDVQAEWLNGLGSIDLHVPIGTLPRHFRRDPGRFPSCAGYLKADSRRIEWWREQIGTGDGPTIGITWKGGLLTTGREQRSLPALELVRKLKRAGARLVCLQHGYITEEVSRLKTEHQLEMHPGISGFADLDEVAALTAALDGVVTVCCTQAHLTGALGVPGLVLVPTNPNWRYGHLGEHMPWYPSLRLIRQTAPSDWRLQVQTASEWVQTLARQAL